MFHHGRSALFPHMVFFLHWMQRCRWLKLERGIAMAKLSFADREFLFLYKRFYGKPYPGDVGTPSSKDHMGVMTPPHIRGEKMCYILSLFQRSIGSYSYTWNHHGPYSPGLLAQLRELDERKEDISGFYEENLSDDVAFTDDPIPESLFWANDLQFINNLLETLELPTDETEAGDRMELLGSLAYIFLNVLPGAPFERIVAELMARKPKYAKEEMIRPMEVAWETLQKLKLVG